MEVAFYVRNTGLSGSFIDHGHHFRQLSASGDVILSHKAGERVCLVRYPSTDRDDGAVFSMDVSQIITFHRQPCGMNPC